MATGDRRAPTRPGEEPPGDGGTGTRRRRVRQRPAPSPAEEAVIELTITPAPAAKAAATGTTLVQPRPATTSEVLSEKEDGTSDQEKEKRPPADWEHFAPAPPAPPGPATRLAARTERIRRVLGHEWTLAILAGLALSVLLNRGALADPRHTLPQDVFDPSLVAYLISWGGHALLHDPANLWHLNAFYPAPYGLAFSDPLLGYAPFALIGTGPEAAVLRYNILYVAAQALAFVGAYALVRQLGIGRIGAAFAGIAFAVAPWRLAQAGHLQVLSTGGIALALAMLARGHGIRWRRDGERPPARPGWVIAGWLLAAWQLTLGFGLGLVFAYVLLGAVLVGGAWWAIRRRPRPSRWLLLANLGGGLIFAGTAVLLAQPYLRVLDLVPGARRTDEWIQLYSPSWRSFLTAPANSLVWGDLHAKTVAQFSVPGEMALLPGFVLYAFALAGLVFSVWSVRLRIALFAGTVVTILLGLGTRGPLDGRAGYLLLLHNLPGFDGLRTPGRLVVWTTLLLALLAAGAVCALVARAADTAHDRGLPELTTGARLALLVPALLVLVEGLGSLPHPAVAPAPAALATVEAPYLVLPTDEVGDSTVMLWSTDRFGDLVNGTSGVVPPQTAQAREAIKTFPDAASVTYLRSIGVRTVVILAGQVAGTPWEDPENLDIDGLGITVDATPDAIVIHLAAT